MGPGTSATPPDAHRVVAADATEDRLSQALVRLARATAATARGEVGADDLEADAARHLDELGLAHTSWRNAYALAMGVPA